MTQSAQFAFVSAVDHDDRQGFVEAGDARLAVGIVIVFLFGAVGGDPYGPPACAGTGAASAFAAVEPDAGAAEPPNAGLSINEAGLSIIVESEGLRLDAYQAGGRWLIGYGHSATAGAGMTITEAEAGRLLREDVARAEETVRRAVRVPVNRNQFSAMVSLAYNLGAGGFSRTVVLERINRGDPDGAADGFLVYDHARVDGDLKSMPHLTERRRRERALFSS